MKSNNHFMQPHLRMGYSVLLKKDAISFNKKL